MVSPQVKTDRRQQVQQKSCRGAPMTHVALIGDVVFCIVQAVVIWYTSARGTSCEAQRRKGDDYLLAFWESIILEKYLHRITLPKVLGARS